MNAETYSAQLKVSSVYCLANTKQKGRSMSVLLRGVKNSFRNPVRTASVVTLLGVAMAFALSLTLANQAVKSKLTELKASGATTLTISPAGQSSGPGSSGGGEPLTNELYEKAKTVEHISDSGATLGSGGFRRNIGTSQPGQGNSTTFTPPESDIDLESPIDAGTLGRRQFGDSNGSGAEAVPDFKLPVQATGISGNLDSNGKNYVLTSGEWLKGATNEAVLGTKLAEHNKLSVGTTFTAYDQTFQVVGIYDGGSDFANASVLMPLETLQKLSDQTGEISSIIVKVDSIENIDATKSALQSTLGKDKVEVSSSAQSTDDAIASLESIQKISVAGVVIAVIAAGVIVFMIMLMIVRERKREIAIYKAIGASNIKITGQFVAEAVSLTICSVIVGLMLALVTSNGITKVLISSNTTDSSTTSSGDGTNGPPSIGGPGGGFRRVIGGPAGAQQASSSDLLKDVQTEAGSGLLLQGLAAVVVISILGSAIPAYAIAKVRPAEVMRGE